MRCMRVAEDALSVTGLSLKLVHRLFRHLQTLGPGILDLHPSYEALLVEFDHELLDADRLRDEIEAQLQAPDHESENQSFDVVRVPVRYDREGRYDLHHVANALSLTIEEVIARHSASTFEVAFFGFMPGFAYLTGLNDTLRVARLATPRLHTPKNAVAIAAHQAAIYPAESPGGWRVIGIAHDAFSATESLRKLSTRVFFEDKP